jgi:hypothetical protein
LIRQVEFAAEKQAKVLWQKWARGVDASSLRWLFAYVTE